MKFALSLIFTFLALHYECDASMLRHFSKSCFSTATHLKVLGIIDPLSLAQKKEMNRFITNGIHPEYDPQKVDYDLYTSVDIPEYKYFAKPKNVILTDGYTETEECPELLKNLTLPIDRNFFIKGKQTRELCIEDIWVCTHYLANLCNLYLYADKNNLGVIHSFHKAIRLGRVAALSYNQLQYSENKVPILARDRLFLEASDRLWAPYFYTHPSDPYSFYAAQITGLLCFGVPDPTDEAYRNIPIIYGK